MGKLYLETVVENGKTVIADSFFSAPFKILDPFPGSFSFHGEEMAEIMVMQASAGILAGDVHELEFVIRRGSRAVITGQSFTKLFRMEGGNARQSVKIRVEKDACLYYLPCPTIPFAGSDFYTANEIRLENGACFAMQDVLACGRKASGERFAFRRYHSRTVVYEDGKPVFAENTRLVPGETEISGVGYFEGYSHQGTAYFHGIEPRPVPETEGISAGISRGIKGQTLRLLGNSSEEIETFIKNLMTEE